MAELTLVLVKPDGVSRCLTGKILSIFEEAGLKLVAMKMLNASSEVVSSHYPNSDEWFSIVGGKTLSDYSATGTDVVKELGTDDAVAIGKKVKGWLVDFMCSGPVVAIVLEGNEAVKNVRRLCGSTLPINADPATIRGRFGLDNPTAANAEKRPVYNLVHASGTKEEAAFEVGLWFPELQQQK